MPHWSTRGGGRGSGVTPALLGVCRQTGLHPGLGTALARVQGGTPHTGVQGLAFHHGAQMGREELIPQAL